MIQVKIAQGGPILYVCFWPHTLADRQVVFHQKRTDLILSYPHVKYFMDFNIKIQQTRLGLRGSVTHQKLVVITRGNILVKQL